MKYRILASDYDGTFLRSDNTLSKENLQAVNSFRSRGGVFTVVTGRSTGAILPFLKNVGYKGLVASFNGAEIIDVETDKILYQNPISSEICGRVFKILNEYNICGHAYPENKLITNKVTKYTESYEKISGIGHHLIDCEEFFSVKKIPSSKMMIQDLPELLDGIFPVLVKEFGNELEIIRTNDHMIDLNRLGINKGSAVLTLAKLFGLTKDDVVSIGDQCNDIPMLKTAGFSVCPDNALDEAKKYAYFISPSNDDDAIKYVIENFCI